VLNPQALLPSARSHWGYFQMRLCALSSASTSAEKAQLSEACLNENVLELTGGPAIEGTKYWIYTGNQGDNFIINTNAKLPAHVSCERCVLQVCLADSPQPLNQFKAMRAQIGSVSSMALQLLVYAGPVECALRVLAAPRRTVECGVAHSHAHRMRSGDGSPHTCAVFPVRVPLSWPGRSPACLRAPRTTKWRRRNPRRNSSTGEPNT
jgi:hypothetical protein